MFKEYAYILIFIFILSGCSGPGRKETYDLLTYANHLGLERPFQQYAYFSGDDDILWGSLLEELQYRSAQFLVIDDASGIISWVEPGTSFIAIPSEISRRTGVTGVGPRTARMNSMVYATARFVKGDDGAIVYLHSIAREVKRKKVTLSDGSFERGVLRAIKRRSAKNKQKPDKEQWGSIVSSFSESFGGSYEDLFNKFFLNVPKLDTARLTETGISNVYPEPTDDLWRSALDVLSQYDTVIRVFPSEKLIIFAQGMALPKKYLEDKVEYYDAILAVQIIPRGERGSQVYVGFVAPKGLVFKAVPEINQMSENERKKISAKEPRSFAAALIADEFFSQLGTQLMYKERWRDKFVQP